MSRAPRKTGKHGDEEGKEVDLHDEAALAKPIDKMLVNELKKELEIRGLNVSGKKAELADRLKVRSLFDNNVSLHSSPSLSCRFLALPLRPIFKEHYTYAITFCVLDAAAPRVDCCAVHLDLLFVFSSRSCSLFSESNTVLRLIFYIIFTILIIGDGGASWSFV